MPHPQSEYISSSTLNIGETALENSLQFLSQSCAMLSLLSLSYVNLLYLHSQGELDDNFVTKTARHCFQWEGRGSQLARCCFYPASTYLAPHGGEEFEARHPPLPLACGELETELHGRANHSLIVFHL